MRDFIVKIDDKYKQWAAIFLVAFFYFLSGKIGLKLAFVNESATAVWPPTGIAIASFLLFGYRIWPAIFLAAFLINFTTTGGVATSLGIALGNTLEGFIASYLVNKFSSGKNTFYRTQDIFKFIFLAALLSTTISANIGVITLILGGLASFKDFFPIWITWWMGDATGALLFTPFIIFWRAHRPLQLFLGKKIEALCLLVVLMIVGISVFWGIIPGIEKNYPLEFLCIPIIIWAAFRFGRREAITAIMLLSGIAIFGTINGFGPFARASQNQSLLLLQSFMAVTTVTALTLAVAVSERRKVQDELSISQARFKALTEKSSEAISLTDVKGNISYVTPSFTTVLGYSPEEVIGKSGFVIIHPDDVNYAKKTTSRIVGHPGKSVTIAIRCLHKDGSWKFVEITSTNLIDNPSVQAVVSNFHDITELIMTEDRIMNEKSKAEALLNSIGDGIIAVGQDGKIILVNKAFEGLLGFKEEELLGMYSFDKLLMEEDNQKILFEKDRPLTKALKTGEMISATHYLVRKNGTKFPALITAAPIIFNKKINGAIEVFHDITKEKEIDEMKNEFISLASHELRTPLSAIKGFVSMINKGDYGKLDKKLERPLELVAASTERLINIVNEMLDVSRIEANRVQLALGEIEVSGFIQEAVINLKPLISQKQIKFVVNESGKGLKVYADRGKVIEILNNLIGNALKFTAKGSIAITANQEQGKIVIQVKDTGSGISETDQKKLFNKFEQLKSKKAGNVPGTGLGLYISREFARKMGGDVWVLESRVGKGSTFAFSLPMLTQTQDKNANKR